MAGELCKRRYTGGARLSPVVGCGRLAVGQGHSLSHVCVSVGVSSRPLGVPARLVPL